MSLTKTIKKNLSNMLGWRTNRKIIVIESDDWGSIRMPSRRVYEHCLQKGYRVDLNPYEKYDSLASEKDLELLFGVLNSYKDYNGNSPIITANCVVANPDFKRIEQENFKKYHYELITDTFKKYPEHANSFGLWKKGIDMGIFYPQYHAREHLNVSMFMSALQNLSNDVHFGFSNKLPGIGITGAEGKYSNNFVEATKYNSEIDKNNKLQIYLEGLDIFETLFGYNSKSIIPTNYIWSPSFNQAIHLKGVRYIQGSRKMKEPVVGSSTKFYNRFLGQKNKFGQLNLVRNCFFEPTIMKMDSPVQNCLSEIETAFRWNKPAIISSHRLNYIGFIDNSNRDRTLDMMHDLLTIALKRWPNIEFMNSVQLGEIINNP